MNSRFSFPSFSLRTPPEDRLPLHFLQSHSW
uniref:Uncharacterized protein n=1 Tax=Anguilla anguilla TaxID=7936 RepID=A0A0E9Q879_ANGAN